MLEIFDQDNMMKLRKQQRYSANMLGAKIIHWFCSNICDYTDDILWIILVLYSFWPTLTNA
jgi:hypothetical protein